MMRIIKEILRFVDHIIHWTIPYHVTSWFTTTKVIDYEGDKFEVAVPWGKSRFLQSLYIHCPINITLIYKRKYAKLTKMYNCLRISNKEHNKQMLKFKKKDIFSRIHKYLWFDPYE